MYHDIEIPANSAAEAFKKLIDSPVGYTVARAGSILGMTRQAVDQAVRKGALRATRLYLVDTKGKRKLLSTEVDRESVHSYATAKHGRQRVPLGYRDDQIQLFS